MLLTAYLPINQRKCDATFRESVEHKNAASVAGEVLWNTIAVGLMVGSVTLAARIHNSLHPTTPPDNMILVARETALGAAFFALIGVLIGNVYNAHYPSLTTWSRRQTSLINILEVAALTIGAAITSLSLGSAFLAPHPRNWLHTAEVGAAGGALLWSTIFIFASIGQKFITLDSEAIISVEQRPNLKFKFSTLIQRCTGTNDESLPLLMPTSRDKEPYLGIETEGEEETRPSVAYQRVHTLSPE